MQAFVTTYSAVQFEAHKAVQQEFKDGKIKKVEKKKGSSSTKSSDKGAGDAKKEARKAGEKGSAVGPKAEKSNGVGWDTKVGGGGHGESGARTAAPVSGTGKQLSPAVASADLPSQPRTAF